jgi:hypothetical protein
VLPTDTRELVLENGSANTARPDQADSQPAMGTGVVLGTEQDGGFSNLVLIRVTSQAPEMIAVGGVDGAFEVQTTNGPARVNESWPDVQQVSQQRGDVWLGLTGTEGSDDLIDVLDHVAIDSSGSLTVDAGERAVIDEFSENLTADEHSTYYEATDPASGITFVIETATSPSAIALGAYTPNVVTPTTVNGTPAWIMTRDGDPPDGVNTGIVWRATPNRVIAISAHTRSDAVMAMAERLQQVSEAEWLAALPGASIET